MDKIEISNEYVRAVFNPDWGGHFSALQFNHPDLGWVDIFMTEVEPTKSNRNTPFFGCFNMVPFANRMKDGIVVGAGDQFQFPINLPEDGLAIHGTGVASKWSVVEHTDASVTLKHTWSDEQNHYHFEAQLLASIDQQTIDVELRLRNLSAHSLPMGLGFHPWFANISQSEVRFGHPMHPDLNSPWSLFPSPDFDLLPNTFKPSDFCGLDANFEDWNGRLDVRLGAISTQLEMSVKGALSEMHVFVKDENDRFCLEPVSHKPGRLDEISACVESGKQISGTMTLSMEKLK